MSFRHPFNFIMTRIPRLILRPFYPENARVYFDLVQKNREHLIQYGDYTEIVDLPYEEMREGLFPATPSDMRYGAFFRDELVGRIDLNAVPRPDSYVIGYWIDKDHCGKHYGSAICRAAIKHAHTYRDAKEIWAGVRNDNAPSLAIMEKLGFHVFEHVDTQIRLRLILPPKQR